MVSFFYAQNKLSLLLMINRNIQDGINYLSKLNGKRIINAIKVRTSFYRAKKTKSPVVSGSPIALAIEPTTSCNLRCPECPSGLRSFTRPTGTLLFPTFKKLINELKDTLAYLTFYFQGEPFLNKEFLDMVAFASKNKIYTATSTNAHYLDPKTAEKTVNSGLDRIIISLDGTTQETYEQYRVGGNINKVFEGTKNIVDAKRNLKSKTPYIVFQYLVVAPNEHQIDEAKTLAKSLGVDEIAFKTAQVYDYENGNNLIPTKEKYSRYIKQKNGTYKLKRKAPIDNCWRMWHSAVVTWDGKVVPCCFDKDAEHEMGNIEEQSFNQIWNNDQYKRFRSTLLNGRENIEMCKNCTEGTKIYGE